MGDTAVSDCCTPNRQTHIPQKSTFRLPLVPQHDGDTAAQGSSKLTAHIPAALYGGEARTGATHAAGPQRGERVRVPPQPLKRNLIRLTLRHTPRTRRNGVTRTIAGGGVHRRFIVGGNWKCNGTTASVKALIDELNAGTRPLTSRLNSPSPRSHPHQRICPRTPDEDRPRRPNTPEPRHITSLHIDEEPRLLSRTVDVLLAFHLQGS
jgi:hypothetical protein